MKSMVRLFVLAGVVMMLSSCITAFSPNVSRIDVPSGTGNIFTAAIDDATCRLVWYLDDVQVGFNRAVIGCREDRM